MNHFYTFEDDDEKEDGGNDDRTAEGEESKEERKDRSYKKSFSGSLELPELPTATLDYMQDDSKGSDDNNRVVDELPSDL